MLKFIVILLGFFLLAFHQIYGQVEKKLLGTYTGESQSGTSYILTVTPDKDFKLEVRSGETVTEYKGSYTLAPLSNDNKGALNVKLQSKGMSASKGIGSIRESKYKPNPKYEFVSDGVVWTIETPSKEIVKLKLPPPPVAKLNAPSKVIEKGSSVIISWKTDNATLVTLNGEKVDASGAKSCSLSSNTLYTLLAEGRGGKATDTMTIFVVEKQPDPEPLKELQSGFLGTFVGRYIEEVFDEDSEKNIVLNERRYQFKFGTKGAFEGEMVKVIVDGQQKNKKLTFKGNYTITLGSVEEIGSVNVEASSNDGVKTEMSFFYEIEDNEPTWSFNDGERFVTLEKK